jgi:hypothetical protein
MGFVFQLQQLQKVKSVFKRNGIKKSGGRLGWQGLSHDKLEKEVMRYTSTSLIH